MSKVFSELGQDLAYAIRALRKAPGFTAVAIVTLALGIGANTAIFSVVRGILLRPLPFRAPEQLVFVGSTYNGSKPTFSSPTNVYDWKAQNHSFTSIALFSGHSAVLTEAGDPERLAGSDVNADFFDILGVAPVLGRLTFTAEESQPNGPPAVLVHEELWRTRFGADPRFVGSMMTLDGQRYRVAGIVPAAAAYPADARIWFPFAVPPEQLAKQRGAVYVQTVARLKEGVTLEQANADMKTVASRLEHDYPDFNAKTGAVAVPLQEYVAGDLKRPLFVLLGSVGFVLLIACANVAGLQLVRGASRGPELAVRTALGAGRGRLVRQLVTESVVLSLAGGVVGLLAAIWGTQLLVRAAPPNTPRLSSIHVDGVVIALTMLVSFATGVLFGLVPARRALAPDVARELREGGRSGAGRAGGDRLRRILVVGELALSVMLLAGAGLLIKSFDRLTHVDPGFHPEGTVSFALSLPNGKYDTWEKQSAFMDQLLERMHAVGGVRQTGAALALPLTMFRFGFSFAIDGKPPVNPNDQPDAEVRVATPDFFATLGIPIVKGRGFTDADRAGAVHVLLITEAGAKKFFPGEDPIGKHVKFGWGQGDKTLQGDIVGIVGDVKTVSLAQATLPQFYAPYAQRPVSSFNVVLHGARDPQAMITDARRAVHELDADLAVSRVKTLDQVVAESVAQPRFYMLLLATFAFVAVVLSAIGIYGVIAYLVGKRAREIGIRLALGASPRSVIRMIVREGAAMAGIGALLGLAGALVLTRSMRALLFEVAPTDPATYVLVTLGLTAVAIAASCIPALRAAAVDPALVMRSE